jgi:hypothetical protein
MPSIAEKILLRKNSISGVKRSAAGLLMVLTGVGLLGSCRCGLTGK